MQIVHLHVRRAFSKRSLVPLQVHSGEGEQAEMPLPRSGQGEQADMPLPSGGQGAQAETLLQQLEKSPQVGQLAEQIDLHAEVERLGARFSSTMPISQFEETVRGEQHVITAGSFSSLSSISISCFPFPRQCRWRGQKNTCLVNESSQFGPPKCPSLGSLPPTQILPPLSACLGWLMIPTDCRSRLCLDMGMVLSS